MNPLQQLMELIGYPLVGTFAKQAVQIGQKAQAKVLSKEEAITSLEELRTLEASEGNKLLENTKFQTAITDLISEVQNIV